MDENKKLSKSFTHTYLRYVKRRVPCPNCHNGKMRINKKPDLWICENCGYKLSDSKFKEGYPLWYCDKCGTYLNNQKSFSKGALKHICQNCGYENNTTLDNTKAICSNCGVILPDSKAILCDECKNELKTKGKALAILAATIGIACLVSNNTDEDNNNEMFNCPPLEEDDSSAEMKCPMCGGKMKGDPPDETRYFNCASCGGRFYVEDDGEVVDVFHRKNKNSKKCENCGQSLSGGSHIEPWENGNNNYRSTKCPHCGYINYEWDD